MLYFAFSWFILFSSHRYRLYRGECIWHDSPPSHFVTVLFLYTPNHHHPSNRIGNGLKVSFAVSQNLLNIGLSGRYFKKGFNVFIHFLVFYKLCVLFFIVIVLCDCIIFQTILYELVLANDNLNFSSASVFIIHIYFFFDEAEVYVSNSIIPRASN